MIFGQLFSVLFSGVGKGKGKPVLKLLLGISLAVIPTAVILAILSYDREFVALCRRIFAFSWKDLFSHFLSLIFGILVGMYFYGVFFSSGQHKCADVLTAESCYQTASAAKWLSGLTALAATLPILAVYAIFFVSQWQYYVSDFSGVLPASLSFAEYARSGFFQLCEVSVINLIIIAALQLFVRRKSDAPAMLTRILSIVFSAVTLALIATAMAKLWMYIDRFGLTPKRVYAGWFMLMLAVVFLLVTLKQAVNRFRLIPAAALVCVALFAVLTLSGESGSAESRKNQI